MTARSRAAVVGGAALVVLIAVFSRPHPTNPVPIAVPQEVAATTPASMPVVTAAAAADAPAPKPGSLHSYDLTFVQSMTIGPSAKPAAKGSVARQGLDKTVKGGLTLVCVEHDARHIRYRATLDHVGTSLNGEPVTNAELLTLLARPFFFDTDANGRVVAFAFDAKLPMDVRGGLKAMIALGQVVTGAGDTWTTREEDTTGAYDATYTRGAAGNRLSKTRVRYVHLAGRARGDADDSALVEVHDDIRIALGADGALATLSANTATEIPFGEPLGHISDHETCIMTLRDTGFDEAKLPEYRAERAEMPEATMDATAEMQAPATMLAMRDQADRNTLNGAKLQDLLGELEHARTGTSQDRGVMMSRLSADFRLRAEDAKQMAKDIPGSPSQNGMLLTGGLTGAATPEALGSLAEVAANNRTPMEVRLNAVTGLGLATSSSSPLVHALAALLNDPDPMVQASALLALGSAAGNLRESDPAAYEFAITTLLNALASAQTPEQRALCFRALGNSGDARVLPLAREAETREMPVVRLAAVASVRRVALPDVDAFLMSVLHEDTESQVRVGAIETAEQFRTLQAYIPALGGVAKSDAAPLVRHAALHALDRVKSLPEALALITWSGRNDPSEDVRKFANELLQAKPE